LRIIVFLVSDWILGGLELPRSVNHRIHIFVVYVNNFPCKSTGRVKTGQFVPNWVQFLSGKLATQLEAGCKGTPKTSETVSQNSGVRMTEAGALEVIVNQQVIVAMKAHDGERTTTLRLIKNALKNKAIEKRELLTPAEEQAALATMIKQRRDSIEQFTKGNRPELAAKEAGEIAVIEEFLPKAMDEAGLNTLVAEVLAELAAAAGKPLTPKEMGQGIKAVQARLQASGVRAEGRLVSEAVKKALAS
jgi:uncharacterized protein YqeY